MEANLTPSLGICSRCCYLRYQCVPSDSGLLMCTTCAASSLPCIPTLFDDYSTNVEKFDLPPIEIIKRDDSARPRKPGKREQSGSPSGENSRHKKQCLAHNLVPSTAPMPVSKRTRSLETPGLGHKTPCEVESGNALPFAPCVKVGLDCTSQAPKPPNRRCRIVSTAASLIPHQLTTLVEEDDESDRVKDETGTSPGLESWALGMYLVSRFEDLLAAEAADTEYADGQCEGDGLELLLDSRMDWAGSVAPFECVW